ncbi:MAG: response regulator transcription factor [Halofilum sp. (in: g-proteobacteria)]|nr:response regulator transcription factor [Halofilum sp. (in: g-proteobacteria)]
MRVLLVEDEAVLRGQLALALRRQGFAVDETGDGDEALYLGNEYPVDVAVLDLGLPGRAGLEVLQGWRESGRTFPVLILTARGRWQEKVAGLEAGADDYLVKPFQTEEVIARLRALVRRAAGWSRSLLEVGPIVVDTASQSVAVAGETVPLTAYEYRLLEYLALHAGEVVSKTRLTEHIYEEDAERDSNVVEVLLARLRRKIDPGRVHEPIETLRGRGYRLRVPGS